MAGIGQSAQDLLEKLDTYREQLSQVEAGLEANPEEESLLKLKKDLSEVIALTEDLVRYQNVSDAKDSQAGSSKSAHTNWIGRTCEAHLEGKWYNAEIQSVRRDHKGIERCAVKFIGDEGTQREYKTTELRLLKPPPAAQCAPGLKCQSIFKEDGLWYDCVILEHTTTGYKVNFKDYNEECEVKFDQIRMGQQSLAEKEKMRVQKNVKDFITPAGFRIPENLKPDADKDTAKQLEVKRRKIHAIKSKQKEEIVEKAQQQQVHGWQKFCNKKSSKSKNGYMTGRAKQSIFSVPEGVDGKVGVTGSGNKMTEFAERSKFTFGGGA